MRMPRRLVALAASCAGLAWAVAATVVPSATVAAQGVTVGLLPPEQTVVPGTQFPLELWVTQAGSLFNAFDAVIRYDPAALTFVPASPLSLQEGDYMRGACGNTFHRFSAAGDLLNITEVLLCQGMALPGPGQLYKLRFQASSTPQVTCVRIDTVQFFDAGKLVNPAYRSHAVIGIGVEVNASPGLPSGMPARLRAVPNPSTASVSLQVETGAAGEQSLEILDARGRLVRHVQSGSFGPGARAVVWDGKDGRGAQAGAGLYLARLRSRSGTAGTRIVLLK